LTAENLVRRHRGDVLVVPGSAGDPRCSIGPMPAHAGGSDDLPMAIDETDAQRGDARAPVRARRAGDAILGGEPVDVLDVCGRRARRAPQVARDERENCPVVGDSRHRLEIGRTVEH
jgi:hypothetical protein